MAITLAEHLARMPYKALRGVATRLGLRQRGQHQKADWKGQIAAGWEKAETATVWLSRLSPAATAGLQRLQQAEHIPAHLFWETYGVVRPITATQHWSPPPWQAPANSSEELYYSGLLCADDGRALSRTDWVTLPSDLRPHLALWLDGGAEERQTEDKETEDSGTAGQHEALSDSLPADALPAAWPLCHDVGQWLIYLHSQPDLRLQHGRWLTRAHLAQLNGRLWEPDTATPLPTQRRSPYLRLLGFLAETGELQVQGVLTPKGWAWLAAPPAAQLAWLWQTWRTAAPAQRAAYALAAGTVSAVWPEPLVAALAAQDDVHPFRASALVHAMFRQDRIGAAFWVANFRALQDVDDVVDAVLAEVLAPLGVVARVGAGVYRRTVAGAALLQGTEDRGAEDRGAEDRGTEDRGTEDRGAEGRGAEDRGAGGGEQGALLGLGNGELGDGALGWVDLPAWPAVGGLWVQAQLAPYGDYACPPVRTRQAYHRLQITPATLARAAAAGYALANLVAAFAQAGIPLPPAQYERLYRWHEQGRQLQVMVAPLLRTNTPAQLAALLAERQIGEAVGEVLAPTVALLVEAPAAFRQRLAQHGQYAREVAPPPDEPLGQAAEVGALWLAGQVYAALGEQLALPLPPPFGELKRLWASLSPVQQAVLPALAAQLHERWLDLLDQRPFMPPPEPSAPAQWRPLLTQAIDTGQRLWLTYFSAGRNMTTRRLIEPYWIEEHRGVPYVRAYCHSAGRVLTFRLDRIEALAMTSDQ